MIKLNNYLKFVIIYYKFLNNKSTLIINNNIKLTVPLILKTNKSKSYLYFFFNNNNNYNLKVLFLNYKKIYNTIFLNILYSLNNSNSFWK